MLLLSISSYGWSQMSYEEFHERYQPTNEKIIPNAELVKSINQMDTEKAANQVVNSVDAAYDGSDDDKISVIAVLSSCNRSKVADILETMTTYNAVRTLKILKDDWIKELVYFLDKETYHEVAPYLVSQLFIPYPTGPFGPIVKSWSPAYAGVFYDYAYSPISGYNNILSSYADNSEQHGFKGFGIAAGFWTKVKEDKHRFIDVTYQNRGIKTAYETGFTNSKVGMNSLAVNFLKGSTFSTKFMFAQGFGGQVNLISLKSVSNTGKTKIGSGINGGLNYNIQLFLNPIKDVPVMLGVRGYAQINLPAFNFNPLYDDIYNLTNSDFKDYKSSVATFGVQVQALYKFGKAYVPKEYKDFDTELAESYDRGLNTSYDELDPRVSADGKKIYFTREDHPYNTKGAAESQDVWISDISNGIENAKAEHLTFPLNQRQFNSVAGISPDGNRMVIKGKYDEDGNYVGKGYSIIEKTKTGWSKPVGLEIKDYADMSKGTYVGAFWSNDGKNMILSFSESSTNNNQSIYVSHLQDDGTYAKPKNIGDVVNKKGTNTHSPYLASDGKTLYFASNREGGYGSHDIWVSKRLDDTWTNWSEPVNLGPEINTDEWQAYYTIDAQGKYAYMVSYENSIKNSADIVRIKLKEEVQPDPVVLVKGRVLDQKTNEPVAATIVYNGIDDQKNYGVAKSDPLTGEYTIVLPYGVNFEFTASASNYIGVSNNLDLTSVGEYKEINQDLFLVPIEVGATVRLNNIFFETGKAELKSSSFAELDRVVKFLKENPNIKIEISGHTDNVGNESFNLDLSQKRAKSVMDYLTSKGIEASRLKSEGYGLTKPVADNSTEAGRAMNRRVEFTILSKE